MTEGPSRSIQCTAARRTPPIASSRVLPPGADLRHRHLGDLRGAAQSADGAPGSALEQGERRFTAAIFRIGHRALDRVAARLAHPGLEPSRHEADNKRALYRYTGSTVARAVLTWGGRLEQRGVLRIRLSGRTLRRGLVRHGAVVGTHGRKCSAIAAARGLRA